MWKSGYIVVEHEYIVDMHSVSRMDHWNIFLHVFFFIIIITASLTMNRFCIICQGKLFSTMNVDILKMEWLWSSFLKQDSFIAKKLYL